MLVIFTIWKYYKKNDCDSAVIIACIPRNEDADRLRKFEYIC